MRHLPKLVAAKLNMDLEPVIVAAKVKGKGGKWQDFENPKMRPCTRAFLRKVLDAGADKVRIDVGSGKTKDFPIEELLALE